MAGDNLRSLLSKLEDFIESNITNTGLEKNQAKIASDWLILQQELKLQVTDLEQKINSIKTQQLLEVFVKETPVVVAMLDRQMRYLLTSDRWMEYFQLDRDLVGCDYYEVFPDIPEYWRQYYADCLAGKVDKIETQGNSFVDFGGKVDWLHWEVIPWHDAEKKIGGLLVFAEITTEKNLLQKKIESCEAQMRSMFAAMSELVFTVDVNNDGIVFLPTKFFEIYEDRIVNQIIEQTHAQLFDEEEAEEYQNLIERILKTQQPLDFEYSLQVDNLVIWYSAKISPISQDSIIWVARDITNRRKTEQNNSYAEKELAQVTLQSIGDGVITTNALGEIQYMNPVAERLTGWNGIEARGKLLAEVFKLIREATRKPIQNPIKRVSREHKVCKLTTKNLLVDRYNREYAIEGSASPIDDPQGKLFGVAIVFRDVTKARRIAQKLSWQATHDPLTKLHNRRKFEEQVASAIEDAKNAAFNYVLCYIDLDRFKIVNDTCGHAAGDKLLKQVSKLLQKRIRAADFFARIGGDEFGLLLDRCSTESAKAIANQLVYLVKELRFVWDDKVFRIGASIGLIAVDASTQDLPSLLGKADSACYVAKELGGNCVHIYDEQDAIVVQQQGQRQWVEKLNRALEENRFCLYAQKIVAIEKSSQVFCGNDKRKDYDRAFSSQHLNNCHYEILLRLVDDSGNLIAPGLFLPAAERYGLMPAIDRWVITTFLAGYEIYCQSRKKRHLKPFQNLYTINLSGASINNQEFGNFLQVQFERYEIPPETICFEITETVAIANLDNALISIDRLKQLGCSIALDDFGSGMSSFNYLKNLPVDYLKIDGSFVKNIVSDRVDYATVESFNHISQIMNIKTIAEFVETTAIMQHLRQIGIDYAQGYGIERPQPLVWV